MKIPIDKNIPITPKRLTTCQDYPFSELEVGDSFFIQFDGSIKEQVFKMRVGSNINNAQPRYNHKYASRGITESGKFIGIRVWRKE